MKRGNRKYSIAREKHREAAKGAKEAIQNTTQVQQNDNEERGKKKKNPDKNTEQSPEDLEICIYVKKILGYVNVP